VPSLDVKLLPDDLWSLLEPLLPALPSRGPQGGRKPVPHRRVLTGLLYVLQTGIPWDYLPSALGYGSASTLWRRLRDWQAQGVWELIHFSLLDWLAQFGGIDWRQAAVDASTVRAVGAGEGTGPNPTDRAKPGSKRHLAVDANGTPLTVRLTPANRNEGLECLPLLEALPPLVGPFGGRPRRRPDAVLGDAAYGSRANRDGVRVRGMKPLLAQPRRKHGRGLGTGRWVVEDVMQRLNRFRRLRVRYERRVDIHLAFLHLACALIVWQKLRIMF
jgi:transposase